MPKYKLLTQHYSEEDKLLEPDTIVGEGTQHAWTRPPTPEMEGLDAISKKLVAEVVERNNGHTEISPERDLPLTGQTPGPGV